MVVALSGVLLGRVVAPGEASAIALDRLFPAVMRPLPVLARRLMCHVRLRSTIGHPWSAADVLMVIVWVLTMPHAAARFQHEILLPQVAHLPAGGIFFVASGAALMELTAVALLARIFAAIMREAGRRVIHRYQHHGGTPGFAQRYPGSLVCFGWPGKRTLDRAELGK